MQLKNILSIVLALAAGLLIGYLLFGKNSKSAEPTVSNEHTAPEAAAEQTYTCSMHPQIRQQEPGICPICEMDLIPLEANTSNDPLVLQMTEEAVKLANIQTTTIGLHQGAGEKVIRLSGKVQADERQASSLVAHVPGRIEKLYITFTNEQVRTGQKLADIYSPDLITAQRELLEAVKLKDINPGLLEAARNKLRYWKIGAKTIEQIEASGNIQESFTLYAEASGTVQNRRVSVGDYITKGQALFDLINLQSVWVLFDAYEDDLPNFSIGDPIEFTSAGNPGKVFKTKISFIDPVIDPKTRVASLRAEFNNKKGWLKPEQFVNGVLRKSKQSKNHPLTVPKSAVLWTGKRSVVYIKMADMDIPSYQFREVEIGESMGEHYQILSGVEAGEEIVTNGNFAIDAAAQLNNQASMMNKQVSLKKEKTNAIPDFKAQTPALFQEQLRGLTQAYYLLKDAFVATDANSAREAAQQFRDKLEQTDMSLVKDEAHLYWMEQLDALNSHSQKIANLEDVEAQRKQFMFLSEALIKTIQAFGVSGENVYVQYCSMAFDNSGADWLSDREVIQNPYFGDKMMKCGTVKKTIK